MLYKLETDTLQSLSRECKRAKLGIQEIQEIQENSAQDAPQHLNGHTFQYDNP